MEENLIITDEDRQSAAYALCVASWLISGVAVGSRAGAFGAIVGVAAGAVFAKASCTAISRAVTGKIDQTRGPMTDRQFVMLKIGVKQLEPTLSNQEVLAVIEQAARSRLNFTPAPQKS